MTKFMPQIGSQLTISLPGEMLRGTVHRIPVPDAVIVEIITEPMSKSHSYKYRDVVACRRTNTMFGEEWVVVQGPRKSIEEIAKQEKENAAKVRVEQPNKITKHQGTHGNGKISAKPSRSDSLKPSKKAPKRKPGGDSDSSHGASRRGRSHAI